MIDLSKNEKNPETQDIVVGVFIKKQQNDWKVPYEYGKMLFRN